MRHVTIAADLVGGIDDDDALFLRQDAGDFAQHGRLADARRPQHEQALPARDQVLDDVDGAVNGTPDAACQPDDLVATVADGADTMQRALHAGAVVGIEFANPAFHLVEVFAGDFLIGEDNFAIDIAGGGQTAQVEYHFQ